MATTNERTARRTREDDQDIWNHPTDSDEEQEEEGSLMIEDVDDEMQMWEKLGRRLTRLEQENRLLKESLKRNRTSVDKAKIKLPKMKDHSDFLRWRIKVLKLASLSGTNPAVLALEMLDSLDSALLLSVNDRLKPKDQTIVNILTVVEDITCTKRLHKLQSEYHSMRKEMRETVTEYGQRVYKLAMVLNEPEISRRFRFVKGLPQGTMSINSILMAANDTQHYSWDDLVSTAEEMLELDDKRLSKDRNTDRRGGRRNSPPPKKPRYEYDRNRRDQRDDKRDRRDNHDRRQESDRDQRDRKSREDKRDRHERRDQREDRNKDWKSKIQCYRCKEFGHKERECKADIDSKN